MAYFTPEEQDTIRKTVVKDYRPIKLVINDNTTNVLDNKGMADFLKALLSIDLGLNIETTIVTDKKIDPVLKANARVITIKHLPLDQDLKELIER